MSNNKPCLFGLIATNVVVPVAAAIGAFALTLALKSEKMKPGSSKSGSNRQAHRREHEAGHEDLNIEEAQELVEKLSSHVSIPASLN